MAYLLQITICILGYLLLSIFTSWLFYIVRVALSHRGRSRARAAAGSMQRRMQRHRVSLVSALEEFHRTQCLFGSAIQVAALHSMLAKRYAAQNLFQIDMLLSFIRLLAFSTVLCVVPTYWYLRGNTERSWYNFLLTVNAFLASVIAYVVALTREPRVDIDADWITAIGYQSCGGANPKVLCAPSPNAGVYQDDPGGEVVKKWVLFALLMLYLVIDHFWKIDLALWTKISRSRALISTSGWAKNRANGFGDSQISHLINIWWCRSVLRLKKIIELDRSISMWSDHWIGQLVGPQMMRKSMQSRQRRDNVGSLEREVLWKIFQMFWDLVGMTCIGHYLYFVSLEVISLVEYPIQGYISVSDWGIGQIVSVTIWTQPILEFVQLEVGKSFKRPCGVLESWQKRTDLVQQESEEALPIAYKKVTLSVEKSTAKANRRNTPGSRMDRRTS